MITIEIIKNQLKSLPKKVNREYIEEINYLTEATKILIDSMTSFKEKYLIYEELNGKLDIENYFTENEKEKIKEIKKYKSRIEEIQQELEKIQELKDQKDFLENKIEMIFLLE